jgi:integrase
MRPGEALALKWSDLDLSNREVLMERTLSAGVIGTTKTGRSMRVDMSLELRAALSRLYLERERSCWLESGPNCRSGYS